MVAFGDAQAGVPAPHHLPVSDLRVHPHKSLPALTYDL
jgi:hypothetical protein